MTAYVSVNILLAACLLKVLCLVASQTSSSDRQKSAFKITRGSNEQALCAIDTPSIAFNITQLEESIVSVRCAPLKALCAMKCTMDVSCNSYNWRDNKKLCELFYYPPMNCAIVKGCSYYQSSDNRGTCTAEIGLHPGRHLVQQNMNGSDFFLWKTWKEYADGFGDPTDNYWIGNDKLFQLTSVVRNCSLEVNVLSVSGMWYSETYSMVTVSGESTGFRIQVAGSDGNATDGLKSQNGKSFSTVDRDNDASMAQSCAALIGVGWWYGDNSNVVNNTLKCGTTNLNGNSTYFMYFGVTPMQLIRSSIWMNCYG